jgi:hypothetical protein
MNAIIALGVTPDPIGATTPVEFARRLRALMAVRRCSLHVVARRSREAGTPISRATVHNLVTAKGEPRRDSVLAFLRGCGLPMTEQIRWLRAYDAVYPDPAPVATLGKAFGTAA